MRSNLIGVSSVLAGVAGSLVYHATGNVEFGLAVSAGLLSISIAIAAGWMK